MCIKNESAKVPAREIINGQARGDSFTYYYQVRKYVFDAVVMGEPGNTRTTVDVLHDEIGQSWQ